MAYDYESAIRSAISDTAVGSMAKSRTKTKSKKKYVTPSKKPKKLSMPVMQVPVKKPKSIGTKYPDISVKMDPGKEPVYKEATKPKEKKKMPGAIMRIQSAATGLLGGFAPYYRGGEFGITYKKDI
jgi:hypothetical protein